MSINTTILDGRLTKDVTVKTINDRLVVNGTLAVDYGFKNGSHDSFFMNFEFWMNANTRYSLREGKKGERFILTGSLEENKYTNKQGQEIKSLILKVSDSVRVPKVPTTNAPQNGYVQAPPQQNGYVQNGAYPQNGGYQQNAPQNGYVQNNANGGYTQNTNYQQNVPNNAPNNQYGDSIPF